MAELVRQPIDLAAMRARHEYAERLLQFKPATGTVGGVGWALTLEDIALPAHADRGALMAVVEAMHPALADLYKLVEDGWLVRNITNDAHFPSYAAQAMRLVKVLAAVNAALALVVAEGEGL